MRIFIFTITLIVGLLIVGCSESSTNPDSDPGPTDDISGLYFMHGTKIFSTYAWPWFSDSEILESDTTQITITTYLKVVEDRPDTLEFFNLEGANSGSPSALPYECPQNFPADCAFAKFDGSNFEFMNNYWGHTYTGTGTLINGKITLDTSYGYRGERAFYKLEGVKIED